MYNNVLYDERTLYVWVCVCVCACVCVWGGGVSFAFNNIYKANLPAFLIGCRIILKCLPSQVVILCFKVCADISTIQKLWVSNIFYKNDDV